jgi:hypothetical protein
MHSDVFFDIFNYFRSEIIVREDGEQLEAAALPLVIRERDTDYQFHRIVLYDRLIKVKFASSTSFFSPRMLQVIHHCPEFGIPYLFQPAC